ncbi:hypothetical protein J4E93_002724 [Alternaria ventricosa]|uniref:uncharacterized protein n=1 Tax=Alternaria ventricosa TaxID=1187951 RepID=UPI0020C3830D|nr:uncharacterized protein J4E93_002724 [Alternaria ventricosa]KAI4650368.1 hypothetical protein J4E93_002724 [Alternaria ventricosa]
MASSQADTADVFDFSSLIEDDPQVTGETTKKDRALLVQADASISREETSIESRHAGEAPDGASKFSIASEEASERRGSSHSSETISSGSTVFLHPEESGQGVPDPMKTPQITPSSGNRDSSTSPPPSAGIENVVESNKSPMTPPASAVPTSSYSLRSRTQSKLVYGVKYHPMDDAIRPSQAAKRRSAHGEKPVPESGESDEASSILDTDANETESDDAQSEGENEEEILKRKTKSKAHKQTKLRPIPTEGTRRSTRNVSGVKASYDMGIHPQDKYLVISSDEDDRPISNNKHKKLSRKRANSEHDSTPNPKGKKRFKATHGRRSRPADYDTSDALDLDSSGAPVFASVEDGNNIESSASTVALTPLRSLLIADTTGHGIRRREGMDVWHFPPGKRYLNHDRDYWPIFPGDAFEIFEEKLEDQLAREAMEASPLNYDHDDKENPSNTGPEPLIEENEGMSIIPIAQYRQSSAEKQVADRHSLVSSALYSDEPPQSYGLDGTDNIHESHKDDLFDGMGILASGQCLPPGQTQPEAQTETETQDSVLGPNLISDISGSDL